MPLAHTLTEAFKKFELIDDTGDGEKTACAMTLLSWVCGERWSDHPECAHPLVASAVIRANDEKGTTPEMRRELVKAGVKGVLDTWWLPAEVVAAGLARSKKDADAETRFDAAMRLLAYVAAWKKNRQRPDLSGAVLRGAVLRRAVLRRAVLSGADLSGADLSEAVLSEAVLSEADLSGADLSGAVLSEAVLSEAVLSEADLRGAHGLPLFGMPAGWQINEHGLWVPK
jgi:hypothetical protein